MKNIVKTLAILSYFLITLLVLNIVSTQKVYAQEKVLEETTCNLSLTQVQNEVFPLSNGSKQIVTYSVSDFQENDECWGRLETLGKRITENSEIAGVYFFTLPPDEISKIDALYKDFSQYGINLIATFWKDTDSGSELRRYPNTTIDGQ